MDHGEEVANETGYSRIVDGVEYELVNTRNGGTLYRGGEEHIRFPFGTRVVTDRNGALKSVIGMSIRAVEGTVLYEGNEITLTVKGNERLDYADGQLASVSNIGVVAPTYR
jgi:hypothetical protein